MPVVSAAILAALCIPAYARQLAADPSFTLESMVESEGASEGLVATSSPAKPTKAVSKAAGKTRGKAVGKASPGRASPGRNAQLARQFLLTYLLAYLFTYLCVLTCAYLLACLLTGTHSSLSDPYFLTT